MTGLARILALTLIMVALPDRPRRPRRRIVPPRPGSVRPSPGPAPTEAPSAEPAARHAARSSDTPATPDTVATSGAHRPRPHLPAADAEPLDSVRRIIREELRALMPTLSAAPGQATGTGSTGTGSTGTGSMDTGSAGTPPSGTQPAGSGSSGAPAGLGSDGSAATAADADVASAELDAARARLAELRAAVAGATEQAEQARRSLQDELSELRRTATLEADTLRGRARVEADELLSRGRDRVEAERSEARAEADRRREDIDRRRQDVERLRADLDRDTREARADRERAAATSAELTARGAALDQQAADLDVRAQDLDRAAADLESARADQHTELARIAGLSVADAKAELMHTVEAASRREAAVLARDIEQEARDGATERARRIVVEAVQRVASAQTAETVVSVLPLPSDEMKGRIIGREGRNIRAFEAVTGVNIIIDDTPEAVLLSCFDPVRREVGRLTLDKLVLDGRIHPHSIEESFERSRAEVDELCLRAAQDALAEVGITDLDHRLIPTLGRLRYRTSYGQNVLAHLVETAHVSAIMAAELGLDPVLIKRCAFLHDIGKALTHEVEGSHAIVGAELLRTHGEDEAVAHAVEAHHNEVQPRTVEAVLTQAADACSAARPGARREALEAYVNRLRRVEEIAVSRPGVEKVFAMQAGREVRVMVTPDAVDDLAAQVIAREVAKQIEDELTYPGQIRVTVVRETRASETAH